MSYDRRSKILDIIANNNVETQQQLVDLLEQEGYKSTQATISRDIRDLKLIKTTSGMGKSYYTQTPQEDYKAITGNSFAKILKETVKDVKASENLIVIKTLSGFASAAAEAIDSSSIKEILGTIAGDNTVLLVVDKKENVEAIVNKVKEVIA